MPSSGVVVDRIPFSAPSAKEVFWEICFFTSELGERPVHACVKYQSQQLISLS